MEQRVQRIQLKCRKAQKKERTLPLVAKCDLKQAGRSKAAAVRVEIAINDQKASYLKALSPDIKFQIYIY